jgi:aryl-alcohol dehydrogenase-like predicted oxidoreductase
VALAWLLSKPEVYSPIVGVSKVEQLDQLVAATKIVLDDTTIAYLEELYQPVENLLSIGFS